MPAHPWFSRAVLLASVAALTVTTPAVAAPSEVTFTVGTRPESVTKGFDGKVFVTIQGAPELGKNDGEVRTLDPKTGAVAPFATGLDNPRGIAFTGKYLVVADTTTVWTIDKNGVKKVLATPASFPKAIEFLNDVSAEAGGGAVYVSEMGGRGFMRDPNGYLWPVDSPEGAAIPSFARIYRIPLEGKITEVVKPSRKTLVLNGVTASRKPGRLLMVDMFYGNVVESDLENDRKKIIATGFRGADGVAQARDGSIYVSSFDNGMVWKMDRDGENVQVLLSGVGRSTTADFLLDERANSLLVPDTLHGTVHVVPASLT
ncbi:Sugar lactone lactonase YvrE [Amycolatopsis xylanica]|uniref:Sugar lactone lactonase YvrE n=1 Tax=Amycolatopsis xylanica TaxID=589385 RepID=A0A1H3QYL3_9PSEU|nr:Sugar lactone lactonase YvrE [Amycolatopsis xylanica]